MELRPATAADTEAIAALHADGWRRFYRGALLDTLHVVHDRQRGGLGRRLMAAAAAAMAGTLPTVTAR